METDSTDTLPTTLPDLKMEPVELQSAVVNAARKDIDSIKCEFVSHLRRKKLFRFRFAGKPSRARLLQVYHAFLEPVVIIHSLPKHLSVYSASQIEDLYRQVHQCSKCSSIRNCSARVDNLSSFLNTAKKVCRQKKRKFDDLSLAISPALSKHEEPVNVPQTKIPKSNRQQVPTSKSVVSVSLLTGTKFGIVLYNLMLFLFSFTAQKETNVPDSKGGLNLQTDGEPRKRKGRKNKKSRVKPHQVPKRNSASPKVSRRNVSRLNKRTNKVKQSFSHSPLEPLNIPVNNKADDVSHKKSNPQMKSKMSEESALLVDPKVLGMSQLLLSSETAWKKSDKVAGGKNNPMASTSPKRKHQTYKRKKDLLVKPVRKESPHKSQQKHISRCQTKHREKRKDHVIGTGGRKLSLNVKDAKQIPPDFTRTANSSFMNKTEQIGVLEKVYVKNLSQLQKAGKSSVDYKHSCNVFQSVSKLTNSASGYNQTTQRETITPTPLTGNKHVTDKCSDTNRCNMNTVSCDSMPPNSGCEQVGNITNNKLAKGSILPGPGVVDTNMAGSSVREHIDQEPQKFGHNHRDGHHKKNWMKRSCEATEIIAKIDLENSPTINMSTASVSHELEPPEANLLNGELNFAPENCTDNSPRLSENLACDNGDKVCGASVEAVSVPFTQPSVTETESGGIRKNFLTTVGHNSDDTNEIAYYEVSYVRSDGDDLTPAVEREASHTCLHSDGVTGDSKTEISAVNANDKDDTERPTLKMAQTEQIADALTQDKVSVHSTIDDHVPESLSIRNVGCILNNDQDNSDSSFIITPCLIPGNNISSVDRPSTNDNDNDESNKSSLDSETTAKENNFQESKTDEKSISKENQNSIDTNIPEFNSSIAETNLQTTRLHTEDNPASDYLSTSVDLAEPFPTEQPSEIIESSQREQVSVELIESPNVQESLEIIESPAEIQASVAVIESSAQEQALVEIIESSINEQETIIESSRNGPDLDNDNSKQTNHIDSTDNLTEIKHNVSISNLPEPEQSYVDAEIDMDKPGSDVNLSNSAITDSATTQDISEYLPDLDPATPSSIAPLERSGDNKALEAIAALLSSEDPPDDKFFEEDDACSSTTAEAEYPTLDKPDGCSLKVTATFSLENIGLGDKQDGVIAVNPQDTEIKKMVEAWRETAGKKKEAAVADSKSDIQEEPNSPDSHDTMPYTFGNSDRLVIAEDEIASRDDVDTLRPNSMHLTQQSTDCVNTSIDMALTPATNHPESPKQKCLEGKLVIPPENNSNLPTEITQNDRNYTEKIVVKKSRKPRRKRGIKKTADNTDASNGEKEKTRKRKKHKIIKCFHTRNMSKLSDAAHGTHDDKQIAKNDLGSVCMEDGSQPRKKRKYTRRKKPSKAEVDSPQNISESYLSVDYDKDGKLITSVTDTPQTACSGTTDVEVPKKRRRRGPGKKAVKTTGRQKTTTRRQKVDSGQDDGIVAKKPKRGRKLSSEKKLVLDEDEDIPPLSQPKRRKRCDLSLREQFQHLEEAQRLAQEIPRHNWLENKIQKWLQAHEERSDEEDNIEDEPTPGLTESEITNSVQEPMSHETCQQMNAQQSSTAEESDEVGVIATQTNDQEFDHANSDQNIKTPGVNSIEVQDNVMARSRSSTVSTIQLEESETECPLSLEEDPVIAIREHVKDPAVCKRREVLKHFSEISTGDGSVLHHMFSHSSLGTHDSTMEDNCVSSSDKIIQSELTTEKSSEFQGAVVGSVALPSKDNQITQEDTQGENSNNETTSSRNSFVTEMQQIHTTASTCSNDNSQQAARQEFVTSDSSELPQNKAPLSAESSRPEICATAIVMSPQPDPSLPVRIRTHHHAVSSAPDTFINVPPHAASNPLTTTLIPVLQTALPPSSNHTVLSVASPLDVSQVPPLDSSSKIVYLAPVQPVNFAHKPRMPEATSVPRESFQVAQFGVRNNDHWAPPEAVYLQDPSAPTLEHQPDNPPPLLLVTKTSGQITNNSVRPTEPKRPDSTKDQIQCSPDTSNDVLASDYAMCRKEFERLGELTAKKEQETRALQQRRDQMSRWLSTMQAKFKELSRKAQEPKSNFTNQCVNENVRLQQSELTNTGVANNSVFTSPYVSLPAPTTLESTWVNNTRNGMDQSVSSSISPHIGNVSRLPTESQRVPSMLNHTSSQIDQATNKEDVLDLSVHDQHELESYTYHTHNSKQRDPPPITHSVNSPEQFQCNVLHHMTESQTRSHLQQSAKLPVGHSHSDEYRTKENSTDFSLRNSPDSSLSSIKGSCRQTDKSSNDYLDIPNPPKIPIVLAGPYTQSSRPVVAPLSYEVEQQRCSNKRNKTDFLSSSVSPAPAHNHSYKSDVFRTRTPVTNDSVLVASSRAAEAATRRNNNAVLRTAASPSCICSAKHSNIAERGLHVSATRENLIRAERETRGHEGAILQTPTSVISSEMESHLTKLADNSRIENGHLRIPISTDTMYCIPEGDRHKSQLPQAVPVQDHHNVTSRKRKSGSVVIDLTRTSSPSHGDNIAHEVVRNRNLYPDCNPNLIPQTVQMQPASLSAPVNSSLPINSAERTYNHRRISEENGQNMLTSNGQNMPIANFVTTMNSSVPRRQPPNDNLPKSNMSVMYQNNDNRSQAGHYAMANHVRAAQVRPPVNRFPHTSQQEPFVSVSSAPAHTGSVKMPQMPVARQLNQSYHGAGQPHPVEANFSEQFRRAVIQNAAVEKSVCDPGRSLPMPSPTEQQPRLRGPSPLSQPFNVPKYPASSIDTLRALLPKNVAFSESTVPSNCTQVQMPSSVATDSVSNQSMRVNPCATANKAPPSYTDRQWTPTTSAIPPNVPTHIRNVRPPFAHSRMPMPMCRPGETVVRHPGGRAVRVNGDNHSVPALRMRHPVRQLQPGIRMEEPPRYLLPDMRNVHRDNHIGVRAPNNYPVPVNVEFVRLPPGNGSPQNSQPLRLTETQARNVHPVQSQRFVTPAISQAQIPQENQRQPLQLIQAITNNYTGETEPMNAEVVTVPAIPSRNSVAISGASGGPAHPGSGGPAHPGSGGPAHPGSWRTSDRMCAACGQQATLVCSGCTRTCYCSKPCQEKDWNNHCWNCQQPG